LKNIWFKLSLILLPIFGSDSISPIKILINMTDYN
jgi:hypothetical protein